MDKSISDFISGFTNACEGKFTIGREKKGKYEYLVISIDEKKLYGLWHDPSKIETGNPPKHTGGKPSYIKIMLEEVRKHTELSVDGAGFFIKIADNIQWNTNLIVNKRTKKALTTNEMVSILGTGRNKTLEIIKELKESELLFKDKDGYKISPNLVQKGGTKK